MKRFILPILAIIIAPTVAMGEDIKAATWNEALEKVPCEQVKQEGERWTIAGTVEIKGERSENPKIAGPELTAILRQRCSPKR